MATLSFVALLCCLTIGQGALHRQSLYGSHQPMHVSVMEGEMVPADEEKDELVAVVAAPPKSKRLNLLQLAMKLGLDNYVSAVKQTKVDKTIDHEGPYTLFAPLDEAFKHIPKYASKLALRDLVKYHVARGAYKESELKNEMLIRSLLSKRDVRINIYHKSTGKVITANGQSLNQTDFDAHNGVIHIINGVMASVYERNGTAFDELGSLPVGTYNVLQRALLGTGLSSVLSSRGPFTLLAPTDEAFDGLSADLVKELLKNESAMVQVLKNHVILGTMYSEGLENGKALTSLIKEKISVGLEDGQVHFGGATVTLVDFSVANGVIHAINKVLIPKELRQRVANKPWALA